MPAPNPRQGAAFLASPSLEPPGIEPPVLEPPVLEPPGLAPAEFEPAFDAYAPATIRSPLVFASPHSGRLYPPDLMAATRLDARAIRRSEDVWVDRLFASAPAHGAPLVTARYARAYLDLNRAPFDLDPAMFADAPRNLVRARGDRASEGLGSIPRIVAEGAEIYRGKLAFAQAVARIEALHAPYHRELEARLDAAHARFGVAVLIDCHSMPAAARAATRSTSGEAKEIVLGDRYGAACAPAVIATAERALQACGYQVGRNQPYAGGYCTRRYGAPAQGRHALQIELARDLYVDETTLEPTAGFERLRAAIDLMIGALAAQLACAPAA